jgi:hypothetical protein
MSVIKQGYDGKLTRITVSAREADEFGRKAELWIKQDGLQHWLLGKSLNPIVKNKKYEPMEVVQDHKGNRFVNGEKIMKVDGQETLAYITLEELLNLRDEINTAIQELVK